MAKTKRKYTSKSGKWAKLKNEKANGKWWLHVRYNGGKRANAGRVPVFYPNRHQISATLSIVSYYRLLEEQRKTGESKSAIISRLLMTLPPVADIKRWSDPGMCERD